MSVYVDDALKAGVVTGEGGTMRGRWSHLVADTEAELQSFALDLGLSLSWVRQAGTPGEHFEVAAGKRALALQFGAVPIQAGEASYLSLAKRTGRRFDVEALRADPEGCLLTLAGVNEAGAQADAATGAEVAQRIRLSRASGFRLPDRAVSVAAPSRWANPHRPAARTPAANAAAVDRFREYLAVNPDLMVLARVELAGLDLACWCSPELPCHGDVWLAIANRGRSSR